MSYYSFFLVLLLSGAAGIPLLAGFSREFSCYVIPGIAWIIAVCHAVCGLFLNTLALRLSNSLFFRVALGGIGIRMLAVAIAVVLLYPIIRSDTLTFTLSLALFYFIYQGTEIAILLRMLRQKRKV